jgi:hypothetical protein
MAGLSGIQDPDCGQREELTFAIGKPYGRNVSERGTRSLKLPLADRPDPETLPLDSHGSRFFNGRRSKTGRRDLGDPCTAENNPQTFNSSFERIKGKALRMSNRCRPCAVIQFPTRGKQSCQEENRLLMGLFFDLCHEDIEL